MDILSKEETLLSLPSRNRSRITPVAIVSLIARITLNHEDSFEDMPEDVLKDLIRRFNE